MSDIPTVYLPDLEDLDALLVEDLGDLDDIYEDDGGDGVDDDGQITPPPAPELTQPPPIGHNAANAPAANGHLQGVVLNFDEVMEPLTPEPLPQQQQDGADHPYKRRCLDFNDA